MAEDLTRKVSRLERQLNTVSQSTSYSGGFPPNPSPWQQHTDMKESAAYQFNPVTKVWESFDIVVTNDRAIRSGQTVYNTGTGFWLGNDDGTPKFSIGNGISDLTWNGTILTITGAINATTFAFGNPLVAVLSWGSTGLLVTGSSTGDTITIDQNANGTALNIDRDITNVNAANSNCVTITDTTVITDMSTDAKSGTTLSITSGVIETLGTITDTSKVLTLTQSHADCTGNCVYINNDATASITLNIDSENTTTDTINAQVDAITTGSIARFYSDSAETGTRDLIKIINDNTAAVNVTPLMIQQDAVTSTNFKKVITAGGVTIWTSDGTTPNGNLSGTAGDICLNGAGSAIFFCTGTTSWT